MVKEDKFTKIQIYTKENGLMKKKKDLENLLQKMEINMKAILKMTSLMEMEFSLLKMV